MRRRELCLIHNKLNFTANMTHNLGHFFWTPFFWTPFFGNIFTMLNWWLIIIIEIQIQQSMYGFFIYWFNQDDTYGIQLTYYKNNIVPMILTGH